MKKVKDLISRLVTEFTGLMRDEEWAHASVDAMLHCSHTAEQFKANVWAEACDYCPTEDASALCEELFADVDIASLEAYLMDKEWISESFVLEDETSKLFL